MEMQQAESNGGAEVGILATEDKRGTKPYYFDKTPLTEDIQWGKDITLRITYNKPTDEDHDEYEGAVVRRVETVNGESSDKTDAEVANRNYFDRIVIQAEKFRRGEKVPFEVWDNDKCLSLPEEIKTTIVVAMGRFEFELVGGDDDALLFSTDDWRVRQFLGKSSSPDVEIFYDLKPLSKQQRKDYDEALDSRDKAGKKKVVTTTETTFQRKARKLFAVNLVGVTGGQIERGVYEFSMRDDYLSQIDSSFKLLSIDVMRAYYRRSRDL